MAKLEGNWDRISESLRLSVRLLADFGFTDRMLTADSVVIPIAYYLHNKNASEGYLIQKQFAEDREKIRAWAVRSLVKPGIWGSGLDTLLLALRSTMQAEGFESFPDVAIDARMTSLGKSTRFEEEEIDSLLDLEYKDKRTFGLISLLYPELNLKNPHHLDHVFPISMFSRSKLLAAGVAEFEIEKFKAAADRLPNLQLIEGQDNVEKSNTLPAKWIQSYFHDEHARETYAERHRLGVMPAQLTDFMVFWTARRARLRLDLQKLLGTQAVQNSNISQ